MSLSQVPAGYVVQTFVYQTSQFSGIGKFMTLPMSIVTEIHILFLIPSPKITLLQDVTVCVRALEDPLLSDKLGS